MAHSRKILVLLAHPALQKSRVNVRLAAAARQIDGVTVHDLYDTYPDYYLDVAREQKLLGEHDTIVFQHPFYWYSSPALLKEWMDLVLEFGYAYGPGGTQLRGKWLLSAISTGGPAEAYSKTGHNRFTISELLRPLELTARLCEMEWLPPFVTHSTLKIESPAIQRAEENYIEVLTALREGRLELSALRGKDRINSQSASDV